MSSLLFAKNIKTLRSALVLQRGGVWRWGLLTRLRSISTSKSKWAPRVWNQATVSIFSENLTMQMNFMIDLFFDCFWNRIFTAIMPMVAAGLIADDPTLLPIRRLLSSVWNSVNEKNCLNLSIFNGLKLVLNYIYCPYTCNSELWALFSFTVCHSQI